MNIGTMSKSVDQQKRDLQKRLGFIGDEVDGDFGELTLNRINDSLDELQELKKRIEPGYQDIQVQINALKDIHRTAGDALDAILPAPDHEVPAQDPLEGEEDEVAEEPEEIEDLEPDEETKEGPDNTTFPGLGVDWTPPPSAGSLTISRKGFDQIVFFEIGSESYYNSRLQFPTWPGWSSGVTIGIGYDIGYNKDSQIRSDWAGVIENWMIDALCSVNHHRGKPAKVPARQLRQMGIKVTLEQAKHVYEKKTLPRFAATTRKAYPGVQKLPPDAQAALLSLIFNRGSSMSNTDKRSEMRALRPAVAEADLEKMHALLLRMRRHWASSSGLYPRRTKEGEMILNSNREYRRDELIVV